MYKKIVKEKIQLLDKLRKLSDNNITYLSIRLRLPYARIYMWLRTGVISDRGVYDIMQNEEFVNLVSDDLKEYINAKFE